MSHKTKAQKAKALTRALPEEDPEFQIAPMIDILLVLLVFFMSIATDQVLQVNKEVVLPVEFTGKAKDPWGGDRLGFEIETTINRKEYDLSFNIPLAETGGFLVGDEVKVMIEIQAVGQ